MQGWYMTDTQGWIALFVAFLVAWITIFILIKTLRHSGIELNERTPPSVDMVVLAIVTSVLLSTLHLFRFLLTDVTPESLIQERHMVMTDTQFFMAMLVSVLLAALIILPIATKVLRRFGIELKKNTPYAVKLILTVISTLVWMIIFYLIRFLLTGATDRATLFH